MSNPTPPSPQKPEEDFVARYRREEREQGMRQSATGVGLEFATSVALFTLAGWGVDAWLDSAPVGILVGCFVGMGIAFYRLIQFSGRMTKANAKAGKGKR